MTIAVTERLTARSKPYEARKTVCRRCGCEVTAKLAATALGWCGDCISVGKALGDIPSTIRTPKGYNGCGTPARARAHRRSGEVPLDPACAKAEREAKRGYEAQRRARAKASTGKAV